MSSARTHATYDGETRAADVGKDLEKILEAAGVEVVSASGLEFV